MGLLIRNYIQRRWGVKLTKLLWGKPATPVQEVELMASNRREWTVPERRQ